MCVCKCAYVCRVWWNGFAPQGWYSNWNGERPERRELCKESNVSLNLTHVAHLWLTWGINRAARERCNAAFDFALQRCERFAPSSGESWESPSLPCIASVCVPYWFFTELFWWEYRDWRFGYISVSWCVFVRARVQWIYLCNVRRTDSNKVHLLEYCKLFSSICTLLKFFFIFLKVLTFYIWKTNIVIWL